MAARLVVVGVGVGVAVVVVVAVAVAVVVGVGVGVGVAVVVGVGVGVGVAVSEPRSLKRRRRMIDWTDAAIEAALEEWWKCHTPPGGHCGRSEMRAALDAAVKAQRHDDNLAALNAQANMSGVIYAIRQATIEECAKVAEAEDVEGDDPEVRSTVREIAAAIRALAEKDGGND